MPLRRATWGFSAAVAAIALVGAWVSPRLPVHRLAADKDFTIAAAGRTIFQGTTTAFDLRVVFTRTR